MFSCLPWLILLLLLLWFLFYIIVSVVDGCMVYSCFGVLPHMVGVCYSAADGGCVKGLINKALRCAAFNYTKLYFILKHRS